MSTLQENHGKKTEAHAKTPKTIQVEAKLHTIFLLVGPARCGKSTFATALQQALVEEYTKLVTSEENGSLVPAEIISSDAYRQMLFGRYDSPTTPEQQETSGQAFEMLMTHLNALTTFPVNRKFVIIDTTGLDEVFRNQVRALAVTNNYHVQAVLFDYSHSEYQARVIGASAHYQELVQMHAKRFKTKVMPSIKVRDWDGIVRVKDPDSTNLVKVSISEKILPYRLVEKDDVYVIVGDVHEHVGALKTLIDQVDHKYIDKSVRYVLVGDYLDKSMQTKETIDFIYTMVHARSMMLIQCNHGSYAYKRLTGQIQENAEVEQAYMTAVPFLVDPTNKETAEKFISMWEENTFPFLKLRRPKGNTVYVTHAPCENRVLGKFTDNDQKAQRNLRIKDRTVPAKEAYSFIFDEANWNHPIHVFGHIAHSDAWLNFKNKWFIDTGAAYGNKLTALCVTAEKEEIFQLQTERLCAGEIESNATSMAKVYREFREADYDLSDHDLKFLNRTDKSEVKYISGTMAPAPSNATELESLLDGLRYFKKRGVDEVILEPKHMGSRCQVYLFRGQPERSFAVSRNGYIIKREGIQGVLDAQYEKYTSTEYDCEWSENIVIDGELMPWSFLGHGLIDYSFGTYQAGVGAELLTLRDDEELQKLNLYGKLGLEERIGHLDAFSKQLDIHGGAGEPVFKGFAILAVDGDEVITTMDADIQYGIVGDGNFLLLKLSDDENEYYAKAKAYFDKVTEGGLMEGIVIKPVKYNSEVIPYMKVRNEEYLRLVYGYDYKMRYAALAKQKRINNKAAISLKEADLGLRMLTAQGAERREIIVKMIAQLNAEKTLDPRL